VEFRLPWDLVGNFRILVCAMSPRRIRAARSDFPRIRAADQGGEWSRITRVGMPSFRADAPHPLMPIGEGAWRAHTVALPGPKLRAIRCKCTHMRPQEKQAGPVSWMAARPACRMLWPHALIGSETGTRSVVRACSN